MITEQYKDTVYFSNLFVRHYLKFMKNYLIFFLASYSAWDFDAH